MLFLAELLSYSTNIKEKNGKDVSGSLSLLKAASRRRFDSGAPPATLQEWICCGFL